MHTNLHYFLRSESGREGGNGRSFWHRVPLQLSPQVAVNQLFYRAAAVSSVRWHFGKQTGARIGGAPETSCSLAPRRPGPTVTSIPSQAPRPILPRDCATHTRAAGLRAQFLGGVRRSA